MAIMRSTMHLTARDDVDAGHFLIHNRGLRGAKLRIGEIPGGELTHCHQAIQRFIPTRYAVRAYHGGGVWAVTRHDWLFCDFRRRRPHDSTNTAQKKPKRAMVPVRIATPCR